MNTLLLIDGSNLLFQMFYGMPSRIVNKDGIAIHGVIGFVGALRKIIDMIAPTHIAVLFDGECTNERKALDEQYKANRPDFNNLPEEELPFTQLPYIMKALDALGIHYAETENCEVDDWIASYAATYGCENKIVISSFDSDFFQLVSDTVTVLRYRGDNTICFTPDKIREKFGISPTQYADYKSLVGDTADNVRGVRAIGPKTAQKLLAAYGTIDAILENLDLIPKRLRQALTEDADRLATNRRLITLKGSHRVPFSLDELTYRHTPFTTNQILFAINLK